MLTNKKKSTPIDIFRSTFLRDRHEFANRNGSAAFDQARTLYRCEASGRHVIINDGFYGVGLAPDINVLMSSLTSEWWPSREGFHGDEGDMNLTVVCALYAHYLPEVGSDFVVEFQSKNEEKAPHCCWRVEANGRAHALRPPIDEGMFHAQTGTFYNLRGGLRWLGSAFADVPELRVCEIESGLFVGIRAGVPGDPDPASRPDDALTHAFSAHIDHGFDTIEFLGSAVSEQYPFQSDRYSEWLGEWVPAVKEGSLDIFILANSARFCDVVEEYCFLQEVESSLNTNAEELTLTLMTGQLRMTVDLGDLYLRGIHTGRSFSDAVRDFLAPSIDALLEAEDVRQMLTKALPKYALTITDGTVLVVSDHSSEIGRWNLLTFVGRRNGPRDQSESEILSLMGFDPMTRELSTADVPLDECPVCGEEARVSKVVRPLTQLGGDPRMLMGVPIGDHMVYYGTNCSQHSVPVRPRPNLSLLDLESAYQAGLEHSTFTLLHYEVLEESRLGHLFIGYDAGSLLLEGGRVKALLDTVDAHNSVQCFAEALFPDVLVVTETKMNEHDRRRISLRASELVQTLFPSRLSPLGLARPLDLRTAAVGRIERAQ